MSKLPPLFLILTVLAGISSAKAEKSGEYGKADIEVDRSVLQELEGYVPPPMFIPSPPVAPPAPQIPHLTAPNTETLLNHPIENNHVFTIQKQPDSAQISHKTPLPVPVENKESLTSSRAISPIPPHKPLVPKQETRKSDLAIAHPLPPIEKPYQADMTQKPDTQNAYKPKAAKTMPAVPATKVEARILPQMDNLPPVTAEKGRPSIGAKIMDNDLRHAMVQDDSSLHQAMDVITKTKENGISETMDQFSMAFTAGSISLDDDKKILLKQNVINKLSSNLSSKIQIHAYASKVNEDDSSARRISLSRALAVRSFLLEKNILPARIDVRALADKTNEAPIDRIDVLFVPQ